MAKKKTKTISTKTKWSAQYQRSAKW